jgi:hypothetical protein
MTSRPERIVADGPQVGWVCGYGSLARLVAPVAFGGREVAPVWGLLRGHRRDWGVAMDNRAAVSDPKHYVQADDGRRFDGHVAFLDVVPEDGSAVPALAIPVDEARLAALDAREVNYDRHDVRDRFDGRVAGGPVLPVWVFRGTPDGRDRARRAAAQGTLAVSAGYVRDVTDAFADQPHGLPAFADSTVPCEAPQRELELVSRPGLLGF